MTEAPFKAGDVVEWRSHREPPKVAFGSTGIQGLWIQNGARFKVIAYGRGSSIGDIEYHRDAVWVEDPRASQFALELPASGFYLVTNPDNLKHECSICHFCCAMDSVIKEHMRFFHL